MAADARLKAGATSLGTASAAVPREQDLSSDSQMVAVLVKRHKAAVVVATLVVALVVAGFAAWFHFHTSKRTASALKIVPFTSFTGQKSHPVFSPDGNAIAFAWGGENDDNLDIYVKLIGAGMLSVCSSLVADTLQPRRAPPPSDAARRPDEPCPHVRRRG